MFQNFLKMVCQSVGQIILLLLIFIKTIRSVCVERPPVITCILKSQCSEVGTIQQQYLQTSLVWDING